jgi:hypothetical protein
MRTFANRREKSRSTCTRQTRSLVVVMFIACICVGCRRGPQDKNELNENFLQHSVLCCTSIKTQSLFSTIRRCEIRRENWRQFVELHSNFQQRMRISTRRHCAPGFDELRVLRQRSVQRNLLFDTTIVRKTESCRRTDDIRNVARILCLVERRPYDRQTSASPCSARNETARPESSEKQ